MQDALSLQLQIDTLSRLYRLSFVAGAVAGICDIIAQFILVRINIVHPFYSPKSPAWKIYRCWIVWGNNIYVVIVPSFLAISYLGQSTYLHLINRFNLSPLLATWVAADGSEKLIELQGTLGIIEAPWGWTMTLTSLAATMTVNTLVTSLIVFKILQVFWEVKRSLGSFSSAAGRPNYEHITFIIIESGMALFVIHLVRIVLTILFEANTSEGIVLAFDLVVSFHQFLNVIISSVHFYSFVLLITFTCRASDQHLFWCGSQWDYPSMTKIPSRKVSEVLIFIIPQVIQISQHWEAVVAYRSRR